MKRVPALLILVALTALALAVRLVALGQESIWFDESFSLAVASNSFADLLTGRQFDPGNPVGYFVLLRGWLEVFGPSIEAARAFSAVTGALVVPAVWLLARTLGASRNAAMLAGFLVAVSPSLVYLGREARVFALLAVVTTLALCAVVAIQRHDRTRAWVGFVVCGVALVHLHYYGFLILVVLGLDLLLWALRLGPRGAGRGPLGRLCLASGLVALGFAPYVPVFLQQLQLGAARSADSWWKHLAMFPGYCIVGRTLFWKQHGLAAVGAGSLAILATVYLPLTWVFVRSRLFPRNLLALVLGLPALVALVSLKVPLFNCRYLVVIIPALMLLFALGLEVGLARARGQLPEARRLRHAAQLAGVALVVWVGLSDLRIYAVPHKTDWRGLSAAVGRSGPDLPVYCYEDVGEICFAYYRPGQKSHSLSAPFGPEGEGWQAEGYFRRLQSESQGFWLVLYLSERGDEEEAIVRRLGLEFEVKEEVAFPPMRAFRVGPGRETASVGPAPR